MIIGLTSGVEKNKIDTRTKDFYVDLISLTIFEQMVGYNIYRNKIMGRLKTINVINATMILDKPQIFDYIFEMYSFELSDFKSSRITFRLHNLY